MIRGVNLIPARRLDLRRCRQRVAKWVFGCLFYGVALLCIWVVLYAYWSGKARVVAANHASVEAILQETQQQLDQIKPRLAQAQTTLAAIRNVGSQPDWSILLRLLAELLDEETVFTSCGLNPWRSVSPAPVTNDLSQLSDVSIPTRYLLRLKGLGKTQAAVSDIVLRLEKTELFEAVTLIETRTEPFQDTSVVAFGVECVIGSQRAQS